MSIKAGAWKANITPPVGCCLAGVFSVIRSEGVQDDLFANALVLSDGSTKVAIVSCDVIGIPDTFLSERILPEIARITDIPSDNIVIGATHIHAGPVLHSPLPEVFGWPDEAYNEYFCKAIAQAVKNASSRMAEVTLHGGKARNDRCVFNRRLKKSGGGIVMNWVDPEYVKDLPYSEATDPELIVVRLDDPQGLPIAMLVNYGNHNNAFSRPWICADMAGRMRNVLEQVYGTGIVTVFLMGCSGNVNWIDHKNPRWHDRLSDTWLRFGTSMAGTVLQALTEPEELHAGSIGVLSEKLRIPERPYCDYDAFVDDTFGPPSQARDFFNGYRLDREKYGGMPLPMHEIDVHALRIGDDIAIVTNPFEYFVEFGLGIKAASPFRYTMVSQLTNGENGYVPTTEAFRQGGYEVRKIRMGSYLAVEAGDLVAECSSRLLQKLKG